METYISFIESMQNEFILGLVIAVIIQFFVIVFLLASNSYVKNKHENILKKVLLQKTEEKKVIINEIEQLKHFQDNLLKRINKQEKKIKELEKINKGEKTIIDLDEN